MLTMTQYQASIYPNTDTNPVVTNADENRKNVAVCFSGGGSRALTCAWGQMLGLSCLLDSSGTSLLDQVRYISSVSGGTWASVLYTFRPESISDADFLGSSYAPSQLFYGLTGIGGMNVCVMGATALGKVPQNFSNLSTLNPLKNIFSDFLTDTLLKGIPLSTSSKWLWMYIVGKNVLADFGLYTFKNSLFHSSETPWNYADAKSFSLSASYAAETIFKTEQAPQAGSFIYARTQNGNGSGKSACPMLIINTNIIGKNPSGVVMSGPVQIPLKVSAIAAGINGKNPCIADDIGGGSVDSFAFTSSLVSSTATGKVSANFPRAYTLADITACSSAFYAATLAEPLHAALSQMQDLSDDELHSHISSLLRIGESIILKDIRANLSAAESQVSGLADLVPQYNYWPVSATSQEASANRSVEFSDGGDLENTGVAGLLAQVQGGIGNVIAFVNGAEVLEMKNMQIFAATQMAPLFGVCYDADQRLFKDYLPEGVNPFTGLTDPTGFLQIFENTQAQFDALRLGLYNANGGEAKTGAAFLLQSLNVIENTLFGIKGGWKINILWVQNAINNTWQHQILDPILKQKLQDGQTQGGNTEFADFPYYSTTKKIYATAAETNTLAQMWAWNVSNSESPLAVAILKMFNT